MRSNHKTQGFHVVEVVLLVGVLALIGFVGYRVWVANHAKTNNTAASTAVPTVTSTKDLDTAELFVKQIDTSSDLSDLSKLEQDLNSL